MFQFVRVVLALLVISCFSEVHAELQSNAANDAELTQAATLCNGADEASKARGFAIYKRLAETGDPKAMGELSGCYSFGVGTKKDFNSAYMWFQRGAGLKDPRSIRGVGTCLAQGWGVKKDVAEGFQWWEKAADAGDSGAMRNIAHQFRDGGVVTKDLTKALFWYEKAASTGDSISMIMSWQFIRGRAGCRKR